MNWISNVVPPKIRSLLRRDTPENLWVKCPESGQLVFHKDLEANLMVVPGSGYHMPISPKARLSSLFDDGDYQEFIPPETPSDPLKFRDIKRYVDRLKENRAKTGAADAITVAFGKLERQDVTVAVQDFAFQGGTLGLAAGETIVAGMLAAIERRTPFVISPRREARECRKGCTPSCRWRAPRSPRVAFAPLNSLTLWSLPIRRPEA